MPPPNDSNGTPIKLSGTQGSINGTNIDAAVSGFPEFRTHDGRMAYVAGVVRYMWRPPPTPPGGYIPFPYDSWEWFSITGVMSPNTKPAPSGFNPVAFTVKADFDVALCINRYLGTMMSYSGATPGLGRRSCRVEFIPYNNVPPGLEMDFKRPINWHFGPYDGKAYLIEIGGLGRNVMGSNKPCGNFTLSWDFSTVPTIGSDCDAALFMDEAYPAVQPGDRRRVAFVDCVSFGPTDNWLNVDKVQPWDVKWPLQGPLEPCAPAHYFKNGDAIPAGKYWLIFGGGAYTLNQDGFLAPTPQDAYVASPEGGVHIVHPFGSTPPDQITHCTLYWSNGAATEPLPFGSSFAFPNNFSLYGENRPDATGPLFTRWGMRYYRKEFDHQGGRIWLVTTGDAGWSDPSGTGDPKYFLYKVLT
jgi:hypothetical protein